MLSGCDVTIGNDKSVSRIHAEIILDPVESLEHVGNRSSYFSSNVRIKDCSKYGTYFERNSSTKEKVRDCPGNETYLKDGDLVSFGTGNATYRYYFVSYSVFSSFWWWEFSSITKLLCVEIIMCADACSAAYEYCPNS